MLPAHFREEIRAKATTLRNNADSILPAQANSWFPPETDSCRHLPEALAGPARRRWFGEQRAPTFRVNRALLSAQFHDHLGL
jgi:hypothetical protein